MPRIKRWFPVSHDFLDDPETIELMGRFGPRVIFMWLRMLSWSDRNDGCLGTRDQVLRGFGRTLDPPHPNLAATRAAPALDLMLTWGWVVENHGLMWTRNHAKYHRTREHNSIHIGNQLGSLPSEPSEPNLPKEDKTVLRRTSESRGNGSSDWPQDDLWLKDLLEKQRFLTYALPSLLDAHWWDAVSEAVNGLDQAMIERELGKMDAWLTENPQRRPTPKGMKRFMRRWLERAEESERRMRK